jgi:hypothetical protein
MNLYGRSCKWLIEALLMNAILPLFPLQLLRRVDETKVRSGMSVGIKLENGCLLLRHLGDDVEATTTAALGNVRELWR